MGFVSACLPANPTMQIDAQSPYAAKKNANLAIGPGGRLAPRQAKVCISTSLVGNAKRLSPVCLACSHGRIVVTCGWVFGAAIANLGLC